MRSFGFFILLLLSFSLSAQTTSVALLPAAETPVHIRVVDKTGGETLPAVTVLDSDHFLNTTDTSGRSVISLSPGQHKLSFLMSGYQRIDTLLTIGQEPMTIDILMTTKERSLSEVVVVASTRNNMGIENSPMKVEVLGPEELSEEAGIKPGNIASLIGDVSGIQIQQTSATTGNSNVRIQGLEGRYTQVLRDGMPLYEGFSGNLGILTIPPLDLRQVELIKGSASTLYGGGAIGGLINLISRRPTLNQTLDALVNYSTLREFNANAFAAKRFKHYGYSLFAGYNNQLAVDVNKDGLSDVPETKSILVHPRLFWYPGNTTTVAIGYNGALDDRKGGDMQVIKGNGDAIHRYYEQSNSQRHSADYMVEHTTHSNVKLTARGIASVFNRQLTNSNEAMDGRQWNYYSEANALIPVKKDNLVVGANIVGDDLNIPTPAAYIHSFSNLTVGAFAQYTKTIKEHTIIEGGIRVDKHDVYGAYGLPRIAVFHRFSAAWAMRAGFGMGYKVPSPFAQTIVEYDPLYIAPLMPGVHPERSYGYNAEVNYKHKWSDEADLFINQAFFLTQIKKPLQFSIPNNLVELSNAPNDVQTAGSDTYLKLAIHHWELYAGYTFTNAIDNNYAGPDHFIPLTPKHRIAFVLSKEIAEKWRFGLEGSFTGAQYRYNYTQTPSYWFLAAMIQRNIGEHILLVLNGENLLDFRMSRIESLYIGSITNPEFKPLWAPIDGRVINFSVRYKL